MAHPSRRFLESLIRDPGTHPKVKQLAMKRLTELEEVRSAAPPADSKALKTRSDNTEPKKPRKPPCSLGSNAEPLPASKDAALWEEFVAWRILHPAKDETVQKTDSADATETGSQPEAPSGIAPDGSNPPSDPPPAQRSSEESLAEAATRRSQAQPTERTTQPIPETKPTTEVAVPVLSAEDCFERDDFLKRQRLLVRQQRALTRQELENETIGGYDRAENDGGRFNVPTPSPEPKPRRDPDLSRWIDPRFAQPDFGQIPPRRQEPEFSKLDDSAGDQRRGIAQIAREVAEGTFEG
jgi:hypothetical protein